MGIWGENSTFLLDKAAVLSQLKLIFIVFKQVNWEMNVYADGVSQGILEIECDL